LPSHNLAMPKCLFNETRLLGHVVLIIHQTWHCRCDNVQSLSLTDIVKHGGGCCILAEHILPELAYKLGRAAKYGA